MRIRPATTDDLPAITAIYNDAIVRTVASFWTEPRPESEMRGLFDASGNHPWLVAIGGDNDEAVAGFAYALRWNPRQGYDGVAETVVYVAESARGRGVGRLLYGELFRLLCERGFLHAVARVAVPNAASELLHESMGMRRVGVYEKIGFKHGREIDVADYHADLRARM
ncbi:MAG: N-acetyltransferase family protein [Planctomycetota bacterium]